MDGWSVTQQMIVYKGRLLKKSSNQNLKLVLSTLVTRWRHISFAGDLTANFGSESRLTSFPSFCVLPSDVAVLFNTI